MNIPALSLIPPLPKSSGSALPCPDALVRAALHLVITSRQFSKAYRCSTLLSYLIERALTDSDSAPPPEQEVGIAVFGRDRNSYFPVDDPIVRVQAGRLRLRLAAYYAAEGAADPLRITVPVGRYQARIAMAEGVSPRLEPQAQAATMPVLMFRPLICLSAGPQPDCFTGGLSDELQFRLYRDLPSFRLIGPGNLASAAAPVGSQRAIHVLEGTVRQDAARLRVSLRLCQGAEGMVTWCAQFDSTSDGEIHASIASQEQMAERCVQALRRHMLDGSGSAADVTSPALR